jgi:acetolactate synthase-1/2/3 large subunit
MKNISVADYVIERLASQGLKHLFFLPGGGCMYLVDALARSRKVKGVALLHEQSVGIAAEAYAQFTNRISACLVTTGPGATNAITPCAAAFTDSTPMLFISGQVKTSDSATKFGVRQLGFQEIPIVDVVAPITKKAVQLDWSMNIPNVIDDLINLAISGRPGPVWLDIPLDIQSSMMEVKDTDHKSSTSQENLSDKALDFSRLLSDWKSAKRPLLLVGNGVRLANESDRVRRMMRVTKTPALLTWKMVDFLAEDDALNAGRPGSVGQRHSNLVQQNCDFILCLGARLDLGQVAYRLDNFAPSAKRYICEVDPQEIEKLPNSFFSYNVDISLFISQLYPILLEHTREFGNHDSWIRKLHLLKNKYSHRRTFPRHKGEGINLYDFILLLSDALSSHDVLVPGSSGACSEVVMQSFEVKMGQRILNSEGLGPMGFGLPAAIGVSIASGNQRVISIDGDGGFLMNIQELISLRHQQLPLLLFVLNNNGYGSIRATQGSYFAGRYMGIGPESGLGLPQWKQLVMGFGIDIISLSTFEDAMVFFQSWKRYKLPLVVEVQVDMNQVTEPRVATSRSSDGSLITDDMQDMSPKLSAKELLKIQNYLQS